MSYNTNSIKEEDVSVSKDLILEKTTQFDIFRHYIGSNLKLGKTINSPLREKDNNPSFGIFKNKAGNIMYKDFGTGKYGDCFDFVSKLLSLDFKGTLARVWGDIAKRGKVSLEGLKIRNYKHSGNKEIFIKSRYFTANDDSYWGQFCISRDTLKKFNVTPIQHYWINDIMYRDVYKKDDPAYAFGVYTKFKIYRPYVKDKKDKFRSSCGTHDMFGLQQLVNKDKILIVTKSLKDVMVLYELGYNSVATQGETCTIPKVIMDDLVDRFDNIYVLYDNDSAGIEGSNTLTKTYNHLKQIYIPDNHNCKDIGELIENKGVRTAKFVMKKLLKNESC